VGSTTTLFGEAQLGLSVLDNGFLLRDLVRREPEAYLGAGHVARFGADPALLTKLLDAGQRLPVHCHPDRAFARRHLGLPFGKTEAWIVLGTDGAEPLVHLGFTGDVEAGALAGWVRDQDAGALLERMHAVPVAAGDTVLVPAGMPHAIGRGVFVVELQEPTDLSVLLEWRGFEVDGARDGHLGLGLDVALEAVDRTGYSEDQIAALRGARGDGALLPTAADPFFRAERHRAAAELEPGYSVLVVVDGQGRLTCEHGGDLPLRRGQTALIPHSAGATRLSGGLEVLRCRPPRP
jgi:mannose-6-phosphate isomerase